ncbi:MAG: hypothetical protein J6T25_01755 [Bacilli bacterium]|nr:hypothetical protein [Bacilli bacterium]
MKKILISAFLVSAFLVTGCNKAQSKKPVYTVTKEQYDQLCYTSAYIPNMMSLNFTVTYKETLNDITVQYVTKFDNGKIFATHGEEYGDFYVSYKEGTYNAEERTWSFDYYYEDDGNWKISTIVNESMPDDVYLPDVGWIVSYEEVGFYENTNYYQQIPEDKVMNGSYHYRETKVQFQDGKITSASWKYKSNSAPDKEYLVVIEVTDYGKTVVNLPQNAEITKA